MRTGTIESDCEALLKNKVKQKRMKSKQSCPRGQGLPNLKTEASSPRLARKRYFDAPSDSLIRLTCYYSLNRWQKGKWAKFLFPHLSQGLNSSSPQCRQKLVTSL